MESNSVSVSIVSAYFSITYVAKRSIFSRIIKVHMSVQNHKKKNAFRDKHVYVLRREGYWTYLKQMHTVKFYIKKIDIMLAQQ